MTIGAPIKAAQYVRMSTEKQVYSTDNQMAAIASYALVHRFDVVRTYADEGRSGLRLKGRAALQEMLRDVLAGEPGYDAILVFDVSRWGRFQDTDESAHYEFLCRQAGVQVHYCAELFHNDGSMMSAVVKNLRRAMAGEYSRDLSAKVWAAQCRLIEHGYKMGGVAGYGLHRLLIDRDGNPKQLLRLGEHKNITTDRVVLVPGDPGEIAVVRRMFRMAAKGMTNAEIAKTLNDENIPAPLTPLWSKPQVRQILIAERYIGNYVFNMRSAKLGGASISNPRDQWIRCEKAFQPIVPLRHFRAAQARAHRPHQKFSDEGLLAHLRKLLAKHDYISRRLVSEAAPPSARAYTARFGTLLKACELIGHDFYDRPMVNQPEAQLEVASQIEEVLVRRGRTVTVTPSGRHIIVDGKIVLALRLPERTAFKDRLYWRVNRPRVTKVDFVLASLMSKGQQKRLYLLPVSRFGKSGWINVTDGRNNLADYEVWQLDYLSGLIDWHSHSSPTP